MENKTFEIHYSLEDIAKVYHANPQWQSLNIIHVAGTNGKGSTIQFLRCLFEAYGLKVGVFTSPSITDENAMYQIGGQSILEETLQDYYRWIAPTGLSVFEQQTLIALRYFYEEKVDLVLMECGMGGLLDATNVIERKLACVLTNVGLDHQGYLGERLQDIAVHKAGIACAKVPFFCGEQRMEVVEIIHQEVQKREGIFHAIRFGDCMEEGIWFQGEWFALPQLPHYQYQNAALALATFAGLVYQLPSSVLWQALQRFVWPGRFERIAHHPPMVLDGAHNLEGMQALVDSIEAKENSVCLFSALQDKPCDAMLDLLLAKGWNVIVCGFDHPRAQPLSQLAKHHSVCAAPSIEEGLAMCQHYDFVLVAGSLYFIAQVRKIVRGEENE
ncbi:MAG: bifunctional folylpolyglutamate synthase/dihydrofolate synthase [Erysipelotrichaceae bacterium]